MDKCPDCVEVIEHGVFMGVEQVRIRTVTACQKHRYRLRRVAPTPPASEEWKDHVDEN